METTRRKILVIDDNAEFVDFVRRFLESEDFQVSVALDGRTGLEKAILDIPDVVLLDLILPDIPGEGVLKRFKEIDKDIAIVIISRFDEKRGCRFSLKAHRARSSFILRQKRLRNS